jgi:hypothetical protein
MAKYNATKLLAQYIWQEQQFFGKVKKNVILYDKYTEYNDMQLTLRSGQIILTS